MVNNMLQDVLSKTLTERRRSKRKCECSFEGHVFRYGLERCCTILMLLQP